MYYYLNVEWEWVKPACGPHSSPLAPADHMFGDEARAGCSLRLGLSPASLRTAPHAACSRTISCPDRDTRENRAHVPQLGSAASVDMELLCAERVSPSSGSGSGGPRPAPAPRCAAPDPVLLRRRVLDNLLRTEERYAITSNYFGSVQTEVTPHMRRLVAEWMLELCEDQGCQEEVFPLAVSYLDRFLSTCTVGKSQVQLLGTACLLLASKLREPGSRALPADLLVFYTANSITLSDLYSWELLVLSKLKWDVAGVTAHDFLPLLLSRLPLRGRVNTEMVQRHAQTFIALAARDYEFTLYSPSTLASCSIAAALRGLTLDGQLPRLHELTRIDLDCLQTCLEQIEAMVQNVIDERPTAPNGGAREAAGGWTPPPSQDKAHSNAATPTDVRDVHF